MNFGIPKRAVKSKVMAEDKTESKVYHLVDSAA